MSISEIEVVVEERAGNSRDDLINENRAVCNRAAFTTCFAMSDLELQPYNRYQKTH